MRIVSRCEVCDRRVWRGRLEVVSTRNGMKDRWWHLSCWENLQEKELRYENWRHDMAQRNRRLAAIAREHHEGPSPWKGL